MVAAVIVVVAPALPEVAGALVALDRASGAKEAAAIIVPTNPNLPDAIMS